MQWTRDDCVFAYGQEIWCPLNSERVGRRDKKGKPMNNSWMFCLPFPVNILKSQAKTYNQQWESVKMVLVLSKCCRIVNGRARVCSQRGTVQTGEKREWGRKRDNKVPFILALEWRSHLYLYLFTFDFFHWASLQAHLLLLVHWPDSFWICHNFTWGEVKAVITTFLFVQFKSYTYSFTQNILYF